MELTAHLNAADREQVEGRLRHNMMAWLTTVRPDGQPVSVPVWFLIREDGTALVYSQAGKAKLRNITQNPQVSLTLDGTDVGRSVVRIQGTAHVSGDEPAADQNPAYLAKYLERIGVAFGTPEAFAERYPAALIITATSFFP
jgi:PPOX class probable F420-dependent enzyme